MRVRFAHTQRPHGGGRGGLQIPVGEIVARHAQRNRYEKRVPIDDQPLIAAAQVNRVRAQSGGQRLGGRQVRPERSGPVRLFGQ